eukprot:2921782-Rhodomonas_salina.2
MRRARVVLRERLRPARVRRKHLQKRSEDACKSAAARCPNVHQRPADSPFVARGVCFLARPGRSMTWVSSRHCIGNAEDERYLACRHLLRHSIKLLLLVAQHATSAPKMV